MGTPAVSRNGRPTSATAEVPVRRCVRSYRDLECRDSGTSDVAYALVGHPAVFDEPCDFRYFKEYIAPGALKKALSKKPLEVVSNWQHDDRWILGHTLNKTLELEEDARGVEQWTRVAPTRTSGAKSRCRIGRFPLG